MRKEGAAEWWTWLPPACMGITMLVMSFQEKKMGEHSLLLTPFLCISLPFSFFFLSLSFLPLFSFHISVRDCLLKTSDTALFSPLLSVFDSHLCYVFLLSFLLFPRSPYLCSQKRTQITKQEGSGTIRVLLYKAILVHWSCPLDKVKNERVTAIVTDQLVFPRTLSPVVKQWFSTYES